MGGGGGEKSEFTVYLKKRRTKTGETDIPYRVLYEEEKKGKCARRTEDDMTKSAQKRGIY